MSKNVVLTLMAALMALPIALSPTSAYAQGAAAPPPGPKPPSRRALRKLRLRFEREPTVKQVQKAALRFFKVHPDRVASYRRGASWKALMPEIEANFNFSRTDGDRRLIDMLYIQSDQFKNGKDFEFTNNRNYTVGVRAHWYLDRLIFNAEVLDVASLVGVQEGLLREITSLYFTRRRLLTIFALNPPKDPGEQITESIRLDEITANIDALTGGWFTSKKKPKDD